MHLFVVKFELIVKQEEPMAVPFSFIMADSLDEALAKTKSKLSELELKDKLAIVSLSLAEGQFKSRVI